GLRVALVAPGQVSSAVDGSALETKIDGQIAPSGSYIAVAPGPRSFMLGTGVSATLAEGGFYTGIVGGTGAPTQIVRDDAPGVAADSIVVRAAHYDIARKDVPL